MSKYSSYAITFRPRGGLSDKTEEACVKWLKKQDFYFAVTEMDAEARHLHAQVWFNEPRARGEVCTAIQRIGDRTIDDWDKAQVTVMRGGVKIATSDWHIDYLLECEKKNELPNVIADHPPENTIPFYPTEEEQEAVRAESNAVDKMMFKLEKMFLERHDETESYTLKQVQAFMANMMYNERTICVITDNKRLSGICKGLFHYLNKSTGWQACATLYEIKEEAELEARKREFEASVEEARNCDN